MRHSYTLPASPTATAKSFVPIVIGRTDVVNFVPPEGLSFPH